MLDDCKVTEVVSAPATKFSLIIMSEHKYLTRQNFTVSWDGQKFPKPSQEYEKIDLVCGFRVQKVLFM